MSQAINRIVLPTRPQPDTIAAIFLLQKFGTTLFPGVETATVTVNPNAIPTEGHLLIDVAGGELDHHGTNKCATELVAEKLELSDKPEFRNLIAYARRDDTKGQGTISKDILDRAFGLSGLIAALNKKHTTDTNTIINIVLPLLEAQYSSSFEHYVALPKLVSELTERNTFVAHTVQKPMRNMKLAFVESDHISLVGYLRSNSGGTYRVVAQRRSTGHVNILTKQDPKIDLSRLIAIIRLRELQLNESDTAIDETSLFVTATHEAVPNWYYDTATNSLLNGGVSPEAIAPTIIPWPEMQQIILHFITECELEKRPRTK